MSDIPSPPPQTDTLNDSFNQVSTLKEVADLYFAHGDAFHVDQTSGGARERVEQIIKFIVTLASPPQE